MNPKPVQAHIPVLLAADVDEWLGLLGEVIEAADRLGVLTP